MQAAFVGFFSSAEGGTAQLGRPGPNRLQDLLQITHHPRRRVCVVSRVSKTGMAQEKNEKQMPLQQFDDVS